MSNQITINRVAIRQNEQGLYCLNDLHTASGGALKHKLANWLRGEQTKELIEELESDLGIRVKAHIRALEQNQVLRVVHGGREDQQGTFVCKELVYAGQRVPRAVITLS